MQATSITAEFYGTVPPTAMRQTRRAEKEKLLPLVRSTNPT